MGANVAGWGLGSSPGLYTWPFRALRSWQPPPHWESNPRDSARGASVLAHTFPSLLMARPMPHHYHTELGALQRHSQPGIHRFQMRPLRHRDRESVAQDAQQAGPMGDLRGANVLWQGWAIAGVDQGRSEEFSVSGSVWAPSPACTKVPRSLLSSGDLCLSIWALTRSCPQEKKA